MPGHIVQQLRYAPQEHGGFYLSEPKAGSSGTVDLDPVVSQVLAEHVREFPPVAVELVDVTSGDPSGGRRITPSRRWGSACSATRLCGSRWRRSALVAEAGPAPRHRGKGPAVGPREPREWWSPGDSNP